MKDLQDQLIELGVLSAIPALTWLYHKVRGQKTQSLRETLLSIVERAVHEVATLGITQDVAQKYVETQLTTWLTDRKMSAPDWLIHEVTAKASAALAAEYRKQTAPATLERLLKQMADATRDVSFDPPKKPDVPPLNLDITPIPPGSSIDK